MDRVASVSTAEVDTVELEEWLEGDSESGQSVHDQVEEWLEA